MEPPDGILLGNVLGLEGLAGVAIVLDQLEIDRACRVLQPKDRLAEALVALEDRHFILDQMLLPEVEGAGRYGVADEGNLPSTGTSFSPRTSPRKHRGEIPGTALRVGEVQVIEGLGPIIEQ